MQKIKKGWKKIILKQGTGKRGKMDQNREIILWHHPLDVCHLYDSFISSSLLCSCNSSQLESLLLEAVWFEFSIWVKGKNTTQNFDQTNKLYFRNSYSTLCFIHLFFSTLLMQLITTWIITLRSSLIWVLNLDYAGTEE